MRSVNIKLNLMFITLVSWLLVSCSRVNSGNSNNMEHLLGQRSQGLLLPDWAAHGLEFMAVLLVVVVGLCLFVMIVLFVLASGATQFGVISPY